MATTDEGRSECDNENCQNDNPLFFKRVGDDTVCFECYDKTGVDQR